MLDPKLKNDVALSLHGLNFDNCDQSQRMAVIMKIKSSQQTNGVLFAKTTRPDIKEITAKKNEYLRELEQKKAAAAEQENLFAERRQKWLQEKRNEAELKTLYVTDRAEWTERMKAAYLAKLENQKP
jgi:hypothetical protein